MYFGIKSFSLWYLLVLYFPQMKYALILLSIITVPAFAQKEIKIDHAKNHVGDSVKFA